MAQFSSVSYGSQFRPYASTNTQQYGSTYKQQFSPYTVAVLLAGQNGGGSNTQGMGGSQGYFTLNPYDTSVSPSSQVKSATAPASSFDPGQNAQLPNVPGGPTLNDIATDPILQQIQAAGTRAVQDARSAAMANAENALIGYGSVQVPDSVRRAYAADQSDPILAALTDANTAAAAQANPDSTLARLANQNVQNQAKLNTGLNAANLYYSSTRGNELGNLANTYRSAQNDAGAQLGGLLGGYEQNVLGAQQTAQGNYLNALDAAWQRWMALNGSGIPVPPGGGSTVPPPSAPETYYNPVTGQAVNYRPIPRPGLPWVT